MLKLTKPIDRLTSLSFEVTIPRLKHQICFFLHLCKRLEFNNQKLIKNIPTMFCGACLVAKEVADDEVSNPSRTDW